MSRQLVQRAHGWWRGLFTFKESLTAADHLRAERIFVQEGVAAMAMVTLQGGVFLVGFAIALGATNYEIGLLTTVAFMAQFAQLGGLVLIRMLGGRRALMVISAGVSRLLWVMIIITPLLFRERGFTFMLMWFIIASATGAIAGPPWNSLFRDLVPDDKRGHCLSRRLAVGTGLALACTLAGGWFIDWWSNTFTGEQTQLYGYSILFAIGLAFGLYGLINLSRLPEPRLEEAPHESLLATLGKPVKDKHFRHLLWFIGIWSFAVNMAAPFFIVYMLKRIGLSIFMITVLTVTSQLCNIVFLGIWARLANRFSNKSVLCVSGTLFLVAILTWAFTTMPERYVLTMPLLFVIHMLSGMSVAGIAISSTNIALKYSPPGQAHAFMTVFALTASLTGCVAPLIGGAIADYLEFSFLSIPISWTSPSGDFAIQAIHIGGLDFVFILAFIFGLYSLQRLRLLSDEGEATERQVMDELVSEMAVPLRSFSMVSGVRRLVFLPLTIVNKTVNKVRQTPSEDDDPDLRTG